jgi:hypothetical protein
MGKDITKSCSTIKFTSSVTTAWKQLVSTLTFHLFFTAVGPNRLYFAAGPELEIQGLFSYIIKLVKG